ncbi:MAG: helix-turn-helix domain-containing protein [Candidatus Acidiferrales bacterium]
MRLLRLRLGLSQEDLAEKCGLHRTYVGAIERAERNITLSTLNRLAVALAVSPEELISSRQWERKAKNQSCLTAFVGRSRP